MSENGLGAPCCVVSPIILVYEKTFFYMWTVVKVNILLLTNYNILTLPVF